MATNFSINARRIRDLQEVTTIGNQFVPSASYVLVDAADANDMYTSYKMKVSSLSNAISGVISQETQTAIENRFNQITSDIKANVENAISTDIVTDEFKNTIKTNVVNVLTGEDGITPTVVNALTGEGGITPTVVNALTGEGGITNNVTNKIVTDLSTAQYADQIASKTATTLAGDNIFGTMVIQSFTTAQLASILETLSASLIAPISAALTADTAFIDTLKDLVNNE